MLTRMQQRRGLAAEWADPVISSTVKLAPGEVGLETDTGKFKIGNGNSVWSALSYYLKDSDNANLYVKLAPVGPGYNQTITGINVLVPNSSTQTPLVVSGLSGQSAVLQRWRDNLDVTLASIDQSGKLTANGGAFFNQVVNVNSHKITNLATPSDPADAVNKQYVDDAIAGLAWKEAVHLIATSNVSLNGTDGTLVIDGHSALDSADIGYRLLLIGQTTASENGIYVYTVTSGSYTLARATDADPYEELVGASVYIQEGTSYGTSSWVQSNHYLTGFADQDWVQFSGASLITAGSGMTKDGNTLNVVAAVGGGIQVNADSIQIAENSVNSAMIEQYTIIDSNIGENAGIDPTKIDGIAITQQDNGTIVSQNIADETIVNGDISPTAAIDKTKISGTAITAADTGTVTSTMISNGTIVNADISGSAAIDIAKIDGLQTELDSKVNNTRVYYLDELGDVQISGTPVLRQVIKYDGSKWVNELPSGGISTGDTPPTSPSNGDAWFDSTDGSLYVRYDDGSGTPSAQWVQVKSNSALEASLLTRMSAVESQLTTNLDSVSVTGPITNTGTANDPIIGITTGTTTGTVATGDHTHAIYAPLAGSTFTGNVTAPEFISNVATGTSPLTVTSTTAVTNLNADLLDGNHASAFATLAGATFTGIVIAPNVDIGVTTAASDTIDLNFSGDTGIITRTAAGNITFTGSNYRAGAIKTVRIIPGAAQRSLTFPASWVFIGSKPSNMAASKTAILTITSFGTTEADCVAAWSVQV